MTGDLVQDARAILEREGLFPENNVDLEDVPGISVVEGLDKSDGLEFGIKRKKSGWMLDKKFEAIFPFLIARELLLVALPRHMQREGDVIDLCNWVVYSLVVKKGLKTRYWNAWYEGSGGMMTRGEYPLVVLAREFERITDMSPGMFYSRLLDFYRRSRDEFGPGYKMKTTFGWRMREALVNARVMNPVQANILLGASKLFTKNCMPPSQNEIHAWLQEHHPFTKEKVSRFSFNQNFPVIAMQLAFIYYINYSFLDQRIITAFFTIKRDHDMDLERYHDLLDLPGLTFRMSLNQGTIDRDTRSRWFVMQVFYLVPRENVDELFRYLSALKTLGFVEGYKILVYEDLTAINNYNNLLPQEPFKGFIFGGIRDEDFLYHEVTNDFAADVIKGKNYLKNSFTRNLSKLSLFLNNLTATFHFGSSRFGSHVSNLERVLKMRRETIQKWFDKALQDGLIFPTNTTNYYLMPWIQTLDFVVYIIEKKLSTSQRREIAKPFPRTGITTVRELGKGGSSTLIQCMLPPGYLNDAFQWLKEQYPGGQFMCSLRKDLKIRSVHTMSWLDPSSLQYLEVPSLIHDYYDGINGLISKNDGWSDFKKKCSKEWEKKYSNWLNEFLR